MTLREEQSAFAQDAVTLMAWCFQHGYEITFGEALRTEEQQRIYVQSGRSKTMHSNHLVKCAIDLNIFKDGKWLQTIQELQPIGDFWESLHPKNHWGGNWKSFVDCPHFERSQ